MLQRTLLSWFLLAMLLIGVAFSPLAAATAEIATAEGAAASEINPAEVSPDKAATMEMKQSLSRFAQERNELKVANEALQNQNWLLIIYSVAMSILSGWLGLRVLAEPTPVKRQSDNTNSFLANTTNTVARKNATITVRNGTTQQPEVVEHAQTRKLFNRNDSGSEARPTVRLNHLEQVVVKSSTGAVTRTKAFSLLEVMISVAVLATVLTAVMSSSYTLRQVQRSAKEQSQVEELTANLAERIMGANWDWIGRDRPDETVNGTTISYKKGAWSWHRREQRWKGSSSTREMITPGPVNNPLREEPMSGQTTLAEDDNLVSVGLLKEKTGIENLSVFVEYYRSSLLEDVFNATTGEAPSDKWRQYAPAGISDETEQVADNSISPRIYPQDENVMNLRNDAKALIVRIVVTWKSTVGGERRHELVFARRK